MGRYIKKPIVIEANQWDPKNASIVAKYLLEIPGARRNSTELMIPTPEGVMHASPGDWIIRGVNGEFYPCKPDIFEKTYEKMVMR